MKESTPPPLKERKEIKKRRTRYNNYNNNKGGKQKCFRNAFRAVERIQAEFEENSACKPIEFCVQTPWIQPSNKSV